MTRTFFSAGPGGSSWLARYHGWLLAGWWLAMQLLCWRLYHGPNLSGDGLAYLTYAKQLATTGIFAAGRLLRYVGYSTFLSLFLKLGLGLRSIGLAQTGIAGLAMVAFYRTARRLSGGHWPTAAVATLALISWLDVQAFNSFILTESLFTSLLIFLSWALTRMRGVGGGALVVGLLVLIGLVRPNGFIALGAVVLAGLSWLHQAGWPARTRSLLVLALLVALPLAWVLLNWLLSVLDPLPEYAFGRVIYDYHPSWLAPPASLQLADAELPPLVQVLWTVGHNLRYSGQLAALRLAYFMGFPKPWHSLAHSLWLVLTLPATYGLAALGVGCRVAALSARVYLASCLLLQIGIVMLTFEDWNARFSGPVLPYWLLLAALGGQAVWHRLGHRRTQGKTA